MTTLNSFENAKEKEGEGNQEVRDRMPSATLHYGSPSVHDRFMYRPFLPPPPPPPPIPHTSAASLDHNGSRPVSTVTPSGLPMSIYTCDRCMHGFTHASDFLHHKAICMGNLCSPEAEVKLRETMHAKVEKLMDTEQTQKTNDGQESINFQHIAKTVNVSKGSQLNVSIPRTSSSPGATNKLSPKSPRSSGVGGRFACRYCDKEFDAMYIQNHELTHLIDSPEKPYSCEYCGRAFANLPACQNHERIHTEPRPYICDLCSKGFMTAGILKTHMLTHSGLKRFVCATCDKPFSTAGNLKTHENIHKGEKPFACGQCGKCFTTAGNLKTHEKIHIGLKPFTCEYCLKSFTTAGNLRTHENIHTGNKPFECDQCHKCFTTAGNLKTHYRLHTGERPYVCNVCSQAYHSSANLRSHQKAQHGIDIEPRSPRTPLFSPHNMMNRSPAASHQSPSVTGTAFPFPKASPSQISSLPNTFPYSKSPLSTEQPSSSTTFPYSKSPLSTEQPSSSTTYSIKTSPSHMPSHDSYSFSKSSLSMNDSPSNPSSMTKNSMLSPSFQQNSDSNAFSKVSLPSEKDLPSSSSNFRLPKSPLPSQAAFSASLPGKSTSVHTPDLTSPKQPHSSNENNPFNGNNGSTVSPLSSSRSPPHSALPVNPFAQYFPTTKLITKPPTSDPASSSSDKNNSPIDSTQNYTASPSGDAALSVDIKSDDQKPPGQLASSSSPQYPPPPSSLPTPYHYPPAASSAPPHHLQPPYTHGQENSFDQNNFFSL